MWEQEAAGGVEFEGMAPAEHRELLGSWRPFESGSNGEFLKCGDAVGQAGKAREGRAWLILWGLWVCTSARDPPGHESINDHNHN